MSKKKDTVSIAEKEESSDSEDVYESDDNAPMGFRIKRKKNVELVHKSKLLKNNSNFICIAGSTGAGKSTILLGILPCFSNKVKYIVVASAKYDDDAHSAIEKYCKHEKINYEYLHEPDECNERLADILDKKKPEDHLIAIFDDWNINYSAKGDDPFNKIMIKCFSLLRSQNCSCIAISQTYYSLPTRCRESTNIRFIFPLDNVHSVRAVMQDIEGKFYDGENEDTVKKDLRNIYKQVFDEPFQFMLVLSHIPAQIRIGWKKIVYPPDQAGAVEGGSLAKEVKQKKSLNYAIVRKQDLYKKALELGMPTYYYKRTTPAQLEKFIQYKSAEGQKSAGNTAPELDAILGEIDESPKRLFVKLTYHITRFKRTENPNNLRAVTEIANKLMKAGIAETQIRYILKAKGMLEYIDF